MNRFLWLGVVFTTVALLFYSIFYWKNRRGVVIGRRDCLLQTTGFEFDLAGTILMIVGSRNIPLTVHGFIGYSALLAMLVKTVAVWRLALRGEKPGVRIKSFGTVAYLWWVAAYLAGGMLAMLELRG